MEQQFKNYFKLTDDFYISVEKLLSLSIIQLLPGRDIDGNANYYIIAYFSDEKGDKDNYTIIQNNIPDKETADFLLFSYLANFDEAVTQLKQNGVILTPG